jgi:hypothetical protein
MRRGMTARGPIGSVCNVALRVVVITLVLLGFAARAHADNVDTLIGNLSDSSDKIRLSATLNLAKLGDQRAIPALAKRLQSDDSKNVRASAAVGLGQLVTAKTKAADRDLAIKALENAIANDDEDFVKAKAEIALGVVRKTVGGSSTTTTSSGGNGIYVNVGPMSSKTGSDDAKFRDIMVKTTNKTLGKVAPTMATTWSGGVPNKQQLAAKGVNGFYVDGTLNELKVEKSGGNSKVSCKISMLLASFPDKSVFGFLSGGAAVQASASDKDIALAREDCVTAVVEDLIAKKIVPTIKTKVP